MEKYEPCLKFSRCMLCLSLIRLLCYHRGLYWWDLTGCTKWIHYVRRNVWQPLFPPWILLSFDHLTNMANWTSDNAFKDENLKVPWCGARVCTYTSADLHFCGCWEIWMWGGGSRCHALFPLSALIHWDTELPDCISDITGRQQLFNSHSACCWSTHGHTQKSQCVLSWHPLNDYGKQQYMLFL